MSLLSSESLFLMVNVRHEGRRPFECYSIVNVMKYRRNWLLSACAYNNGRQGTRRLIKSMRLTVSVCLIERAWQRKGGAIYLERGDAKIKYTIKSIIQGPNNYGSFLPSSTLTQ